MNAKQTLITATKILLPLLLGGTILYWMYRDFDFTNISNVLLHEMDWTWMLLSFPFGIMAQVFRAWRWRQMLEPMGEHSRTRTTVYSIFLSYAASLVIPRIGEFTRCGVMKRYDGVSFGKALGTVVTERAIDSLVILMIMGLTLLFHANIFMSFFDETGMSFESVIGRFSTTGWIVTLVCGIAVVILLHILLKSLSIYDKVKTTFSGIWQGVISLRGVKSPIRFSFFTLGIWGSYFLHYYLTFFCFDFTSDLGFSCVIVSFVVGSIACIVPTPNGAGPWHFAVKTLLILYGVVDERALYFVLIVHTTQTFLVILLGIWAAVGLSFTQRRTIST